MDRTRLEQALTDALADRQLLAHPFYQRWSSGTLDHAELGAYAEQYRPVEAAVPVTLSGIHHRIAEPAVRRTVTRHLADEEGGERTHLELFEDFAAAAGAAAEVPAGAATRALLSTYAELVESGPATGLAALYAYESQAPAIAASKAEGLRRLYGFDAGGTAFWDEHTTVDEVHAAWTLDGIAALATDADLDTVVGAARRAADAWWAFLDEREAARPQAIAAS